VLELDSIMPEFLLRRYATAYINIKPKNKKSIKNRLFKVGLNVKSYFNNKVVIYDMDVPIHIILEKFPIDYK